MDERPTTAHDMTEPEPSFEDALAQLEQILRRLEDGTTNLEESLSQYERGIGLLKRCYGQLRDAEQRILLLTGSDDDGRPVTEPFTHSSAVLGADAAPRRRTRLGSKDGTMNGGDGSVPF